MLCKVSSLTLLIAVMLLNITSAALALNTEAPATNLEPSLYAQGLCQAFIGEYVSHDHAIQVRNQLSSRGFNAWIVNLGCLTCRPSTRTYAVYAMVPCHLIR